MIEWIIGAAVVGGLLISGHSSKSKSSFRLETSRNSVLQKVPNIDRESIYSEWRSEWEGTIDQGKWVPKALASRIVKEFPPREDGASSPRPASEAPRFEAALALEFEAHNKKFITSEKQELADFFNSIERNPLTDEQMDSCICMDDAVQIVAAAGSGKTSTIVARIGYALKQGLVQPEQVLVLAFNRSVKDELEARIAERLEGIDGFERVEVKTFNAFGLDVIGKSTGRKPRLADWVQTGGVQVISEIVDDLRKREPEFRTAWDMFRTIFGRDLGDWSNIAEPKASGRGATSIRTADGTFVKSEEERMISDFLFYHGVDYEYERPYEYDTATESYSQYYPDFYYPRINLYHEHFALDAKGCAPEHFSGDYVAGVRWKRQLHEEMGTDLFETTSDEIRNGAGLEKLKQELEARGEALEFDGDRKSQGQEPIPTRQLASTIRAFQQHVKSNALSNTSLHDAIARVDRGHRDRMRRFVHIYERISDEWQKRLSAEESVDFDDMLLMATGHIENGEFKSPYQMILADEFQDVSQAKLRLLKSLKQNAGPSASLCVVGDDWQGINRFAGADISVMTDFSSTFKHSTQLALTKTFRCPQLICDASSQFIQKNPKQIRKQVQTTNTYARPLLYAFAASTDASAMIRLEEDLRQLYETSAGGGLDMPPGTRVSVMLLGRYRKDKPAKLAEWKREFGDQLTLKYSTAHASKGLEADYVMLLNVTEGYMGFPSQIEDDPVLSLAMPHPDPFPFAEERRLFYVALTRARRQTRIYSLRDKLSRFLTEISKDGFLQIETEDGDLNFCPKCNNGTLRKMTGKFGLFEACSNSPRCDFKRTISQPKENEVPASPSIRLKSPISKGAVCPSCKEGKMVVRKGRNNEPFLGCSTFPKCRTTAVIAPVKQK